MKIISIGTPMTLVAAITAAILVNVLVVFAQQEPRVKLERQDLLQEVLDGKPSVKTLWYDSSIAGSYLVNKFDVLKGLPDVANARGIKLRGLLVSGPGAAPNNVFYIYSFVADDKKVRVNELTVTRGTITYKSTGVMTEGEFQSFFKRLIDAKVLYPGLPADKDNADAKYNLLLVRWSAGKLDSYYGSNTKPKPGGNFKAFGQPIGDLLRSLSKTFPVMPQPRQTSTRPGTP